MTNKNRSLKIKIPIIQGGIVEKLTALIFCFFIASSAFASTNGYDLKMEVSMNGKHVSSPRVITKEGETASITQDSNGNKMFVEVVATEKPTDNKKAIHMNFVVGTISPTGEKKIEATPQIITMENEKATISVGNKKGKSDFSLTVIAKRKAL